MTLPDLIRDHLTYGNHPSIPATSSNIQAALLALRAASLPDRGLGSFVATLPTIRGRYAITASDIIESWNLSHFLPLSEDDLASIETTYLPDIAITDDSEPDEPREVDEPLPALARRLLNEETPS